MGILRLEDLLYHPKQRNTGLMVTFFFVLSFLDELWEKKVKKFIYELYRL